MRKMKELLFSEKGMKIVNTLFFLAAIFYKSGLLFVAYFAWIVYLFFASSRPIQKEVKLCILRL